MCQSCGRGRETTLGHIRYRDSAEVQVGWCLCSAWFLCLECRGETRVSLLYGVLPVISPRGLTDDASLYLLNPRRLVCRGVVSRDVHTLRHITPGDFGGDLIKSTAGADLHLFIPELLWPAARCHDSIGTCVVEIVLAAVCGCAARGGHRLSSWAPLSLQVSVWVISNLSLVR